MAPIAVSSVPCPVTTMTGTSGRCATMRSHSSSPLIPGICRSVSTDVELLGGDERQRLGRLRRHARLDADGAQARRR